MQTRHNSHNMTMNDDENTRATEINYHKKIYDTIK